MELWIPITIAAAFLQNLRSAAQKQLKSAMGTTGATFVRFGFGFPFVLILVGALHFGLGYRVPAATPAFLAWTALGGLTQIGGTFLLIHLFSYRNFAVGTAYSRTEPAQAALFGLLFLGERVTAGTLAAIAISVFGVMLISVAHEPKNWRSLLGSLKSPNALIGIASGTLFGIAAVAYRAASLSLGGPNYVMQAAMTLAWVICFQTVIMFVWMLWKDRAEIARVGRAWKLSLFTGLAGASASFGWFAAMTLQHAAMVKALGQIELLFTFAASVFFFREKILTIEAVGCLLVALGIVVLVLVG